MRNVIKDFRTFQISQVSNGLQGQSGNVVFATPKKDKKKENIFDKMLESRLKPLS